ncbi:MAG: sulfatase-like hydrolase/transferase [Opitutales bacterium]|nr:sulfatase-like hydrolase/transferase [Opitutales bacterium]
MKRIVFCLLLSAVLNFPVFGKPNVILVLCDDLDDGDVHCLAPKTSKIPTPHIDRLAKEVMDFFDSQFKTSI